MPTFGKGEKLWETIKDGRGNTYYITSKDCITWYLYSEEKKLGRGTSPYQLEEKYIKFKMPRKSKEEDKEEYPDEYTDDIQVTQFEMLEHERIRKGGAPATEEEKESKEIKNDENES